MTPRRLLSKRIAKVPDYTENFGVLLYQTRSEPKPRDPATCYLCVGVGAAAGVVPEKHTVVVVIE